jgi:hypothetical protein
MPPFVADTHPADVEQRRNQVLAYIQQNIKPRLHG